MHGESHQVNLNVGRKGINLPPLICECEAVVFGDLLRQEDASAANRDDPG